ncbi:hypothetical protein DPEC_G00176550 [Dallia pectoralis]|uniref:Uncharacterized protein n=1 Tax=Dallia pectoralis TaxID=75939 RepID=A0ACC2GF03_DALPE|nr:hypothetical protein DPEC_G00176550 [Dallia pectoralis]
MKSDGVAMATAEPSIEMAQGTVPDETLPHPDPSAALPANRTAPLASSKETNGAASKRAANLKPKTTSVAKPRPGMAKPRPGTAGSKTTTGPASMPSTSRPGTAPNRTANGVKPLVNDLAKKAALDKKKTTAATGPSTSAAVAKRPVGVAFTVRTQTKVADRKPAGAAKPDNSTNSTRAAVSGAPTKRASPAGPSNGAGARPKTTAPRPATTAAAKPNRTAVSKTSRPATAHSGLSMGTLKPSPAASTGPAFSRVGPTAPSAGSTSAVQAANPAGPAKKYVGKPPTTATTRKPPSCAATKTVKPDPPKPVAASRSEPTFKRPAPTKAAADIKSVRSKSQEPKPLPTRKATRPPAMRQPLGNTSPGSPSNKSGTTTPRAIKRVPKPTQSVLPFTGAAAADVPTLSAAEVPEVTVSNVPDSMAMTSLPAVVLESQAEVATSTLKDTAVPSPPQSPLSQAVATAAPMSPLSQDDAAPLESLQDTIVQSGVVSGPESTQPMLDQLLPHADPTVEANATPSILDVVEKVQLNMDDDDDEEEEEREGSQQVSVSEMSGTQPTEESRPGSAGPAGSGWRAGGAPLSELDSEEVSCSQQGASELSARVFLRALRALTIWVMPA